MHDCGFVTGHVPFHSDSRCSAIRILPLSAATTVSGTITKLTPVCLLSTSVHTGSFPSSAAAAAAAAEHDHCLLSTGV